MLTEVNQTNFSPCGGLKIDPALNSDVKQPTDSRGASLPIPDNDYPTVTAPYSIHIILFRDWNTLVDPLMRSGMAEVRYKITNQTM